ncbi:hypothetical protein F8388_021118 [Cannabis sativa]|uniref:RING-type domain-containing protein n=1 Tax=Cannabis sativa TaxID=3483 RepID=A0A7J6H028_CANSA|nr:hypothetical protein G4B88_019996 [Cannabis sativa]KAF4388288.1 hypothetical protein F8388_021118 [Cannabis sativa]
MNNSSSNSGHNIISMFGPNHHNDEFYDQESQEPPQSTNTHHHQEPSSSSCTASTAIIDPFSRGIFYAAFRHFWSRQRQEIRNNPFEFLRSYLQRYAFVYAFKLYSITIEFEKYTPTEDQILSLVIGKLTSFIQQSMRKPSFELVVDNLTSKAVEEKTSNICSVCLENFKIGEDMTRLICGHVYHKSCVLEWSHRSGQCPLCRKELLQPVISVAVSHISPEKITILARFDADKKLTVTLYFPQWKPKRHGNGVAAALIEYTDLDSQ